MQIIPVIDILGGTVVRGVAGRRDEYRPVESVLTGHSDPRSVASAFRDKLGLSELYVADLDAILHEEPHWNVYRRLADDGFQMLVDAGVKRLAAARKLRACGVAGIVAALETSPSVEFLQSLCQVFGPERVIFSLDLKQGRPLGHIVDQESAEPWDIACTAIELGFRRLIVLDLSRVGVGQGTGTDELCRRLRAEFSDVRIITGGGVRNVDDLRALVPLGLDGVLVASALHDGRIGRDDLVPFREPERQRDGSSDNSPPSRVTGP